MTKERREWTKKRVTRGFDGQTLETRWSVWHQQYGAMYISAEATGAMDSMHPSRGSRLRTTTACANTYLEAIHALNHEHSITRDPNRCRAMAPKAYA